MLIVLLTIIIILLLILIFGLWEALILGAAVAALCVAGGALLVVALWLPSLLEAVQWEEVWPPALGVGVVVVILRLWHLALRRWVPRGSPPSE